MKGKDCPGYFTCSSNVDSRSSRSHFSRAIIIAGSRVAAGSSSSELETGSCYNHTIVLEVIESENLQKRLPDDIYAGR